MLFLQISTDPSQQFSAPFKAGNSRQVQTSYKPQNTTQRKLATLYPVYTSSGETGVLMTLKHWVPLAHTSHFHFDVAQALAFSRSCVKQCRYHTSLIIMKKLAVWLLMKHRHKSLLDYRYSSKLAKMREKNLFPKRFKRLIPVPYNIKHFLSSVTSNLFANLATSYL